jgi:hypothetical protein
MENKENEEKKSTSNEIEAVSNEERNIPEMKEVKALSSKTTTALDGGYGWIVLVFSFVLFKL